jgi:uncharacterized integral membrane protein
MTNERSNVPPLPEPVKTRPAVAKTLIAAMLAVLFIGFLLVNSEDVVVEFLWWDGSLPLWLILVISALTGIVIWELAGYLRRRRR